MTYLLYDYAASANCLKARILLRLLDLPWKRVPVDLFAGEAQTAEHLARNPAGRTPVLELPSGETIAESGAILAYLAQGTRYLPGTAFESARALQWMFFEQNLLEPNVGTARFWRLTGRHDAKPESFADRQRAGASALDTLERGLTGRPYLVGETPTIADIALYGYSHVADEAGIDTSAHAATRAWLARLEAFPGFVNDLEPYPTSAMAGAAVLSVHDA